MPDGATCPRCGSPLPSEGWEGLCPNCVVRVSLETPPAAQGEGAISERGAPEPQQPHSPLHGSPKAGASPETAAELSKSDFVLEQTGMMIGRYKLLQQIGEGGFGVVFMAEQTEPVQRKVALKVIKAGMDTREVIARFEAERQALALMDHPNIAKVLDAGSTERPLTPSLSPSGGEGARRAGEGEGTPSTLTAGRPYFVMELVRGLPITQYCDECNLSTRERLELFIKVCRAVQHAHQKGVIHRDLKPTNVLVTLHDGEPVPKVIDFGVAKALGQKLTDKTLFTRFEQMLGTPAYMSPEQAALSGLDIDTRSDIYSLGVLLYELLTGVTPFDAATFRQAALDEIRRMIQETEPPKPSTRLTELVAADVRRLTTKSEIRNRQSLLTPAATAEEGTHQRRARRPRLDHDEGDGERPAAALRDGQRAGRGPGAPLEPRASAGPSAQRALPILSSRATTPGRVRGGSGDCRGVGAGCDHQRVAGGASHACRA